MRGFGAVAFTLALGTWALGVLAWGGGMAGVAARAQDAGPASRADQSWAGDYIMSEMELIAELRLRTDGSFLYGLTVGSLDETARGRWRVEGDRVVLTSEPRPIAPTVGPGPVTEGGEGPFAIRIMLASGREPQGIDFWIGYDRGDPVFNSSQGEPWTNPPDEKRTPRTIAFEMDQYRLKSGPFPLDPKPGRTATFIFRPNDFGVADLTDSYVTRAGDTLTLRRPEGVMMFKRIKR